MARDPRKDPRPGDVFRKSKRKRTVRGLPELRGPWVTYTTPTDVRGVFHAERKEEFLKWAKDAEVIAMGAEGAGGSGKGGKNR